MERVNYITSEIEVLLLEFNITDKESFLSSISSIICQYNTDEAIKIMENFGSEGKYQATAIKVNYGY